MGLFDLTRYGRHDARLHLRRSSDEGWILWSASIPLHTLKPSETLIFPRFHKGESVALANSTVVI
jgi:hypothetical protein